MNERILRSGRNTLKTAPRVLWRVWEGGEIVRKIDRLLMKAKNAQGGNVLKLAYIAPGWALDDEPGDAQNRDKWGMIAHIEDSKGNASCTGITFYNTQEEAMRAAREMEAALDPSGKRKGEAIYITYEPLEET